MPTFTRLLGFLRPYRASVISSAVLAAFAMVATVAIPDLSGRAIDAIRAHDRDQLLTLALLVAGAGLIRLALSAGRRLVAGRVSLGVEYDLRNLLFRQLQSFELAFFDRQQTGQLMSRATVDLQSIRFFLGYGLVFIMQSASGDRARRGRDVLILRLDARGDRADPGAARRLRHLPLQPPRAPALHEVQQRIGELTADVEENISGVRVVKAFAREAHQRDTLRAQRRRACSRSRCVEARLQARYNPLIGFLPQIGLAAILLVGGQ